MRAMQVADYGAPLHLVDAPVPVPTPVEVGIEVHVAGVNFPDLLLMQGRYQAKPPPPFAPGFEVAGRVSSIGEEVTHVAVGDRVAAYIAFGGYAEMVAAPANSVFLLPDGVDFEAAAVTPIAYGTGLHALVDRGRLAAGEIVVVLGAAGGVGLAAVHLAKLLGAEVVACVGSEAKIAAVRAAGADHAVNYVEGDVRSAVLEISGGRGADIVYDPVGGDAMDEALRYLAPGGRLLVIGFTSGRISEIPANRLLLKESSVVGVFWGRFADREPEANRAGMDRILAWESAGTLRPVIADVLPLESAPEALDRITARTVVGKLALRVR